MIARLIIIAASADRQSEPPSTLYILVWLATFIIFVWGALSGWLANATHRMWAGTPLLPGVMSDLPTLRRIYRWFGIFLVLLACGMCIAAFIQRLHHATPVI
jgi:hypothetical protein